MQRKALAILIFFFLCAPTMVLGYAGVRYISNNTDNTEEGTLRVVLTAACDDAGDDTIEFAKTSLERITIELNSPLVIPDDCKGKVSLSGSLDAETVLSGTKLTAETSTPGDSCIFNVYADSNTIQNFTFADHADGAAVCFFGQSNILKNNLIGITSNAEIHSNLYGVVLSDGFAGFYSGMDGSQSVLTGNTISYSLSDGVSIHADNATLTANIIQANGGCPDEDIYASQYYGCVSSDAVSGYGVNVAPGYSNIFIGGDDYETSANVIQFNRDGGISVPDPSSQNITVTHNRLSRNYGALNLDINGDGMNLNDFLDADAGADGLLNYVDHIQFVKLMPQDAGIYWVWGVSLDGEHIEIYQISAEDRSRGNLTGGGDEWFMDADVANMTFSHVTTAGELTNNAQLTVLNFDALGNTSEFSPNFIIGTDSDGDGVTDDLEYPNGIDDVDLDDDGLSDGEEDLNHDGLWQTELMETRPDLADTDGDGLSDYFELHGDASYEVGVDTHPLVADTDGDGLADGAEDKNYNGIIEVYLGETNPLMSDTDSDSVGDGTDTCPSVYNPYQEVSYCSY